MTGSASADATSLMPENANKPTVVILFRVIMTEKHGHIAIIARKGAVAACATPQELRGDVMDYGAIRTCLQVAPDCILFEAEIVDNIFCAKGTALAPHEVPDLRKFQFICACGGSSEPVAWREALDQEKRAIAKYCNNIGHHFSSKAVGSKQTPLVHINGMFEPLLFPATPSSAHHYVASFQSNASQEYVLADVSGIGKSKAIVALAEEGYWALLVPVLQPSGVTCTYWQQIEWNITQTFAASRKGELYCNDNAAYDLAVNKSRAQIRVGLLLLVAVCGEYLTVHADHVPNTDDRQESFSQRCQRLSCVANWPPPMRLAACALANGVVQSAERVLKAIPLSEILTADAWLRGNVGNLLTALRTPLTLGLDEALNSGKVAKGCHLPRLVWSRRTNRELITEKAAPPMLYNFRLAVQQLWDCPAIRVVYIGTTERSIEVAEPSITKLRFIGDTPDLLSDDVTEEVENTVEVSPTKEILHKIDVCTLEPTERVELALLFRGSDSWAISFDRARYFVRFVLSSAHPSQCWTESTQSLAKILADPKNIDTAQDLWAAEVFYGGSLQFSNKSRLCESGLGPVGAKSLDDHPLVRAALHQWVADCSTVAAWITLQSLLQILGRVPTNQESRRPTRVFRRSGTAV
eukprot:TRINITY_DN13529_c0_g1_i1.p1 TRINITY_DN13529_c0_g1~~TRINITY_DN13529_c0_g1_i1.p1  ORF type:complete len:637 (+),score=93.72 TRINITY_DN13529_c0_g1_i1:435-2345(+)